MTTKAPSRQRVANDYYPTPSQLVTELLEAAPDLKVHLPCRLFEPCAGHGAIAGEFSRCITNDFYPDGEYTPDYALDATKGTVWELVKPELTITNPPYEPEAMLKILQNAWNHSTKGMVFLIRLGYLEPCANRAEWLEETSDHLRYWIPINPRPKFRKDVKCTDNITVAWAVWLKSFSWKELGLDCPFKFVTGWKNKVSPPWYADI